MCLLAHSRSRRTHFILVGAHFSGRFSRRIAYKWVLALLLISLCLSIHPPTSIASERALGDWGIFSFPILNPHFHGKSFSISCRSCTFPRCAGERRCTISIQCKILRFTQFWLMFSFLAFFVRSLFTAHGAGACCMDRISVQRRTKHTLFSRSSASFLLLNSTFHRDSAPCSHSPLNGWCTCADAGFLVPRTHGATIASQPCDFVYEEPESARKMGWRWWCYGRRKEERRKNLDSYIFLGFLFHNDRHRHVDGTSRRVCVCVARIHGCISLYRRSRRFYPFTYLKNAR